MTDSTRPESVREDGYAELRKALAPGRSPVRVYKYRIKDRLAAKHLRDHATACNQGAR